MARTNVRFRMFERPPEGLTAKLVFREEVVPVTVVDISAVGAAVFVRSDVPNYPALVEGFTRGEVLTLVIESPKIPVSIGLAFVPKHVQQLADSVVVGARLRLAESQTRVWETALVQVFNRRRSVRARATPQHTVPVGLSPDTLAGECRGTLWDLSLGGVRRHAKLTRERHES